VHAVVAVDGRRAGGIVPADEVRPAAADIAQRLHAQGIRHVAMISGDRRAAAERVGRQLGLDHIYAEQGVGTAMGAAGARPWRCRRSGTCRRSAGRSCRRGSIWP
jgi:magnesium-transporting ATPase (P-type)